MIDIIIGIILLTIIGGAALYIVKAKKNGVKCIGCPSGGNCASKNREKNSCNCDCNCQCDKENNM